MNTRTVELMVGLFVAGGFIALFFLAMQVSNLSSLGNDDGYEIRVPFENIGGLKVRSPVSASGVRVGRVSDIVYDPENLQAMVTLRIESQYRSFDTDTIASIYTAGLLGEQYVSLEPGGSDEMLKDGDQLALGQPALVLERLVGQVLFDKATDGGL